MYNRSIAANIEKEDIALMGAAAGEELDSQSAMLTDLIKQFRLRNV